jgi:hypothetical protein
MVSVIVIFISCSLTLESKGGSGTKDHLGRMFPGMGFYSMCSNSPNICGILFLQIVIPHIELIKEPLD